jgi:hypothetical protein
MQVRRTTMCQIAPLTFANMLLKLSNGRGKGVGCLAVESSNGEETSLGCSRLPACRRLPPRKQWLALPPSCLFAAETGSTS